MTPRYISHAVRERVRKQAGDRCGYCLSRQHYVLGKLEIEHITPQARGGNDDEDNLWLSCRLCNGYKGTVHAGQGQLLIAICVAFSPASEKVRRVLDGKFIDVAPDASVTVTIMRPAELPLGAPHRRKGLLFAFAA